MANAFISLIHNMVSGMVEPENRSITSQAKTDFSRGMDKANEYRGHPTELFEALKLFEKVDSRPLFYAGIAYIFLNAAYEQGNTYNREGVDVSQEWLDKATALAEDVPEILIVQAYIHIRGGNFGSAYDTFARLEELGPYNFYARCAQLTYYVTRKNKQKFMETYPEAVSLALTTTRKAYIQGQIAKHFLTLKMLDESIDAYLELAKITPGDPWMWHNLSLIFLQKGKLIQAWRCNNRALEIMDFGNARWAQGAIHQAINRRAIIIGVIAIINIIFWAWLINSISSFF